MILKILVWKTREPSGEPEVEVKMPTSFAKWIPKMMMFVPKKTKEEVWGADADLSAIFSNLEQMVAEVGANGSGELLDVKTKEGHVKILVE